MGWSIVNGINLWSPGTTSMTWVLAPLGWGAPATSKTAVPKTGRKGQEGKTWQDMARPPCMRPCNISVESVEMWNVVDSCQLCQLSTVSTVSTFDFGLMKRQTTPVAAQVWRRPSARVWRPCRNACLPRPWWKFREFLAVQWLHMAQR